MDTGAAAAAVVPMDFEVSTSYFDRIPDEVLMLIFSYLVAAGYGPFLSSVCKRFSKLLSNNIFGKKALTIRPSVLRGQNSLILWCSQFYPIQAKELYKIALKTCNWKTINHLIGYYRELKVTPGGLITALANCKESAKYIFIRLLNNKTSGFLCQEDINVMESFNVSTQAVSSQAVSSLIILDQYDQLVKTPIFLSALLAFRESITDYEFSDMITQALVNMQGWFLIIIIEKYINAIPAITIGNQLFKKDVDIFLTAFGEASATMATNESGKKTYKWILNRIIDPLRGIGNTVNINRYFQQAMLTPNSIPFIWTRLMDSLCKCGQIEEVKLLHQSPTIKQALRNINPASTPNDIEYTNSILRNQATNAAYSGCLELLQWLHSAIPYDDMSLAESLMDAAIHNTEGDDEYDIENNSIYHIHIVRWLQNVYQHFPGIFTLTVFERAVSFCDTAFLDWLQWIECDYNEDDCVDAAISHSRPENLQWIIDNFNPDISEEDLDYAILKMDIGIIRIILNNGLFPNDDQTPKLIDIALANNAIDIIDVIIANGGQPTDLQLVRIAALRDAITAMVQ
jgi:hypothetical protein